MKNSARLRDTVALAQFLGHAQPQRLLFGYRWTLYAAGTKILERKVCLWPEKSRAQCSFHAHQIATEMLAT